MVPKSNLKTKKIYSEKPSFHFYFSLPQSVKFSNEKTVPLGEHLSMSAELYATKGTLFVIHLRKKHNVVVERT